MKELIVIFTWLCILFTTNVMAEKIVTETEPQAVKDKLNNYLWEAARNADDQMISAFIAEHYDLNVQDAKGYTAVILSAYNGHYETVKILLENGANPCVRDNRGNTALMGAIFKGEIKIAKLLISAPCHPDQRNNAGQTAAMYASLFQRTEILKDLQEKGADIEATDMMGNSARSLSEGELKGINSH